LSVGHPGYGAVNTVVEPVSGRVERPEREAGLITNLDARATQRRHGRPRHSVDRIICFVIAVAMLASCSQDAPDSDTQPGLSAAPQTGPAAAGLASQDGHTTLTARELVDTLMEAGLAVPNAVDTTAQECRGVDCTQSIVTDTLRIKSFPTTAQAERYATSQDLPRASTVVVSFAPPLTEAEEFRYRTEIERLAN